MKFSKLLKILKKISFSMVKILELKNGINYLLISTGFLLYIIFLFFWDLEKKYDFAYSGIIN